MSPSAMFNRSIPILGMLLFISFTEVSAQIFIPSLEVSGDAVQQRSTGHINIVAVMVEFQQDENRFTSGDGTFDLAYLNRDDITIDPLPHDRAYFQAHLDFVKNYFERVSNGILELDFEILPTIYQLDKEMKAYSPLGEDGSENYKLANLARDTWTKVAESGEFDGMGYDPDRTMFMIFHAGAGRDLELLGTSLVKTPQDIPSVYLGQDSFRRLMDDPDFDGFSLGSNGMKVNNTAILPQTESRPGKDITDQEFVLELSINGLLAAQVGSFIGLPDLFNTDTGESGIGRFGLMDGASMFSYLGLFPPEPSAWEKAYLGWQTPFDIELNPGIEIELPAAVLHQSGSIARHRISSDEYFLVENRHRDLNGDGLTLTIRTPEGELVTHTVSNDDVRFDPFNSAEYDEILTPGVLVDVSNFDWSLPGGLDVGEDGEEGTEDDRELSGGILIWHIDEAVIRNNMDINSLNNDPNRRGVSLVEADGSNDIGRPIQGIDGSRFSQGHAFDFWWSGNDFTVITSSRERFVVYENEFRADTKPPNLSNTGSPSFFEFFEFSDNIPMASFRARKASSDLVHEKSVSGKLDQQHTTYNNADYTASWPLALSVYESGNDTVLILPTPETVFAVFINDNDQPVFNFNHPGPHQPFLGELLVITQSRELQSTEIPTSAWKLENSQWVKEWENDEITASRGLPSSLTGDTLDLDLTRNRLLQSSGEHSTILNQAYQRSESNNGLYSILYEDRIALSDGSFEKLLSGSQNQSSRLYTGILDMGPDPGFYLLHDSGLDIIQPGQAEEYLTWIRDVQMGWPALFDFNQDGITDAIFVDRNRNQLAGHNLAGATLDNFPLLPPSGSKFTGTPIFADITGDGNSELLIAVQDSLSMTIQGYDSNLRPLQDFPLYVGSVENIEYNPIHPVFVGNILYAVSHTGDIKAWEFPEAGDIGWAGQYGNGDFNKVSANNPYDPVAGEDYGLLNSHETYNWPNPAKNETYIRYETSESADINISVINMNGSTIYETSSNTSGGMPEEIRISTSQWGSGVYYCRVRASGNGRTETQLIKILVIR
ncbi:MAG: T9SS type A sorting domain-containing protein [Balneolales bacterium]